MTADRPRSRGRRAWRSGVVRVVLASAAAAGLMMMLLEVLSPVSAEAAGAPVTVTPAPDNGQYHDGQTVAVSVGPNASFVPNTRVVILECADPGGSAANLPTSLSHCDENTVQADTVLVQGNGAISDGSYPLYALPSSALGEQSNWQPVCSATQQCVLFVGEDQNDFTKPKFFSAAFTVTAANGGSPPATATTAPAAGRAAAGVGGNPGNGVSAAVSLPAATLAFTGVPGWAPCLAALGLGLAAAGAVGRRAARRWGR